MMVSEQGLAGYLAERTDLFDARLPITVKRLTSKDDKYVDGYINDIFSATQAGKAFIVKLSTEQTSSGIDIGQIDPRRNYIEYQTYQLRRGMTPERIPQTYGVDEDNHLFIIEDLSSMEILRFALCRGERFPELGPQVGQFLATCQVATSAFALDRNRVRALDRAFDNSEMRAVIVDFILALPRQPVLRDSRDEAIQKYITTTLAHPDLRYEWKSLITQFGQKRECLVHGDFHTSNTFVSPTDLKVIDMEYTMMGPFSYDIGYFLANFLSQYAAFSIRGDDPGMCDYLLETITAVYEAYFACFSDQCPARGVLHRLFTTILQDSCGYMAQSNISRIGHYGEFPDFDALPDPDDQFIAKFLSMKLSVELLRKRHQLTSPDQIIASLRETTASFLANTMAAIG